MSEALNQVKRAIRQGDKQQARVLLKPLLKENPSADAWTLAAMVTDTREQAIKCLKRALAIDEWHTDANRMLSQLEQIKSADERGYAVDTGFKKELEESQRSAREKGQFFKNFVRGLGGMMRRGDEEESDAVNDQGEED
ncbi:MAG: hypothetical protein ACOCX5_02625 [Chloroflexota bacterium]